MNEFHISALESKQRRDSRPSQPVQKHYIDSKPWGLSDLLVIRHILPSFNNFTSTISVM